jgi:hypothetical protein
MKSIKEFIELKASPFHFLATVYALIGITGVIYQVYKSYK